MITRRTRIQLAIFALITLLGVSFVGARYARLDRLFYKASYDVNAQFLDSGGIFKGAEVSYRGVEVGRVADMRLTRDGIDVVLAIKSGQDKIPADTEAVVANKSAVGEQYVDLQPKTDSGPYLKSGSIIPSQDTQIPVSTTEFLTNTDKLVNSIPQGALRTAINDLGTAFAGTGLSLGQIIDSSNHFIQAANVNFDTTTALLRDSNVALRTQVDKASAIRSFARDLALFSGTMAGHDLDLRTLIDNGSATANELRTFLQQNNVPLGQLLNDLVTTGEITIRHINGTRQLLVLYPWVVEGGYSVLERGPSGHLDARFGMVTTNSPAVCNAGYAGTDRRPPQDGSNRPMPMGPHCAEPPSQTNARGAQNAPNGRVGADYRAAFNPSAQAPVVAIYDVRSGKVTWTDQDPQANATYSGSAAQLFGKDAWQQLLLGPVSPAP